MSGTQLQASHELIVASVVETAGRATATEAEEDTLLNRKKLQPVMGLKFIAAATHRDRNIKPIDNFAQNGTERRWILHIATIGTGCMSRMTIYW